MSRRLFNNDDIEVYPYEDIPLDRDVFMMDEEFLNEYEAMLVGFLEKRNEYNPIGYVSYIAIRAVHQNTIELSWYPNYIDRFHEIRINMPRSAFITCASSWTCDEKPHLFVTKDWYEGLHRRTFSVFALVDAIGVKEAIIHSELSRDKLVNLRSSIDDLATEHPDIAFVSFADTLILKQNFTPGIMDKEKLEYSPEKMLQLTSRINDLYRSTMNMETYAVFTQGGNEYFADSVLHLSDLGNHVSLNSLGIPFAQLLSIETEARMNIKKGEHPPCEIYMDEQFMRSMKFKFEFDKTKSLGSASCSVPMAQGLGKYFYSSRQLILDNLQ